MIPASSSWINDTLARALAGGPDPDQAQIADWEGLWISARDHCLVPYLCKIWAESGFIAALPKQVAERFSRAALNTAERNGRLMAVLAHLNETLAGHDIPVLVSKGLPVGQTCYEDLRVRVLYDLDLIIRPHQSNVASETLQGLGYVPFFETAHHHEGQSLFWQPKAYHWNPEQVFDPEAPCFVELHTTAWEPHWHGFDLECQLDLWQGRRTESIAGIPLNIPCEEKLLVHLAVHYGCNVLEANARLMHLLDIILLIRRYGQELNWESVLEDIKTNRAAGFCFLAFDLAIRTGAVEIPKEVMAVLRRATPPGIIHWLQVRGIEDATAMNLRRPDRSLIYFLHWHMATGWHKRARVLLYSIRTPWDEGTGLERWKLLGGRMFQRFKHLGRASKFGKEANFDLAGPNAGTQPQQQSSPEMPTNEAVDERRVTVKKIFYNTVLQSAGKIISAIIGIVTVAVMSRYLGMTGFGEYTTVTSFMGLFSVLADLGLYLVTTKQISQSRTDETRILGNVLALRFLSALVLLSLGAVAAMYGPYSKSVKQGMFVTIIAFSFMSGTQVLAGLFQKYLIVYQLVISELIQRLSMLGLVLLFAYRRAGLLAFVFSLSLSSALHFAVCLWQARRLIVFRLRFDFGLWKEVLEESWPLALSGALNLVYFRTDTLLLSIYKSAADVGIYGLPRKIMEVLLVFPALFSGLIMPFMSRFAYSDWKRYRLYLQKSLDAIFLAIVPMVFVTMFFARQIINAVGGTGFQAADSVLKIIIFAAAAIYVGLLLGYAVVALGVQRTMLWGYLLASLVGLGLYFVLIPKFSYFGAAIATLVIQVLVCAYAYFVTSRKANFYPSFLMLGKALLAAVPAVVLYKWVLLPWSIEALLGLVLYFAMLLILKAIPGEFLHEIFERGEDSGFTKQAEMSDMS